MIGETLAALGRVLTGYGLETLWQSAVLLPVAGLAAWVLRRHSARVRGRLWWLFMLSMPVLPLLTQWAGSAGLPQHTVAPRPIAEVSRHTVESGGAPNQPAHAGVLKDVAPASASAWVVRAANDVPPPVLPPPPTGMPAHRPNRIPLGVALAAVYVLVCSLLLVHVAMGYAYIIHRLGHARPCRDERVRRIFAQASAQVGCRPAVRVCESERAAAPALVGIAWPTVLMPPGYAGALSDAELFSVAIHECAHARQRDPAKLLLMAVLRAAYWWHPLVWWAARRVRRLMEEHADAMVLQTTDAPAPYARLLTRLAEMARGAPPELLLEGAGLLQERQGLRARVGAILAGRRPRRLTWAVLLIVAVLLAGGVAAVVATPLRQMSERAEVMRVLEELPDPAQLEYTLRFKVYDAHSGKVLPGVEYWVGEWGTDERKKNPAAGEFEYTLPPDMRSCSYEIEAQGYGQYRGRINLFNARARVVAVEVPMAPGATVSGTLVNEDGVPIEEAQVRVSATSSGSTPGRFAYGGKAVSDPQGRWAVHNVPKDYDRSDFLLEHPDYVTDLFFGHGVTLDMAQDLELVMERGVPFAGRVIDNAGKGIAGAQLTIRRGDKVRAQSAEDGRFAFPHCGEDYFSGKTLSVTAPGYAGRYICLNPAMRDKEYEVVLQDGRPLRVCFRGKDRPPMAHAKVFVSIGTSFDNQVHFFNDETDAEGVLTISNAPLDVQWDFSVDGQDGVYYERFRGCVLPLQEKPHTFGLSPVPKITILAVDAETDAPLERFSVTPGSVFVQEDRSSGRRASWGCFGKEREADYRIEWNEFDRQEVSGIYQMVYGFDSDRPVLYRVATHTHYPEITRWIHAEEGDAALKVALHRGEPLRVRVLDAAGNPATDVRAGWAPKKRALRISQGSISRHMDIVLSHGDEDGWVDLAAARREKYVLAVTAGEGLAVIDGTELEEGQTLTLTPWGSVAGEMKPQMVELAEGGVRMWTRSPAKLGGIDVGISTTCESVDDGAFFGEKLYPGEYWVGPVHKHWGGNFSTAIPWTTVIVEPEQVSRVSLSGGRAVRGHLEMPEEAWAWWRKKPKELQIARDHEEKEVSGRLIFLKTNAEGDVWSAALPPGEYAIKNEYIVDPDKPSGGQRIRFHVQTKRFTIPEDAKLSEPPLDIGAIEVLEKADKDAPQLEEGDEAPDFTVTTLEGDRITLSDLRGKHVLIDFWATWCGPCRKEIPRLKKVWERYGDREDFVLLGLSLDDDKGKLDHYLEEQEMAWPQAFLDGWYGTQIPIEYNVRGIPEINLIGPDGRIIATDLRGRRITKAVEAALE